MVSSLGTFAQSKGDDPWIRNRLTCYIHSMPVISSSITGTYGPLAYGSYRKTIDSKWSSVLWNHNKLARKVGASSPVSYYTDTGGFLWIEDFSISQPTCYTAISGRISGGREYWSGPVVMDSDHMFAYRNMSSKELIARQTLPGMGYNDLVLYGTRGISRSIPGIPEVSVFAILGELREGLFSLPLHSTVDALSDAPKWANKWQVAGQTLGSEFLNWVFGILPTLMDANGLVAINSDSVQEARQRFNREIDKTYRRRRTLENSVTTVTTNSSGYIQHGPTVYLQSRANIRKVVTTHTHVWFEGSFNHSAWKPTMDSKFNELLKAAENYGSLPNAERLWQLVPYSWLADWFLNIGEILTNISYLGHSGLTMLYGYVMSETTQVTTITGDGKLGDTNAPYTSSTTSTQRVRQRIRASPYGFGLKISDLSQIQLAILASLGITRTKLRKSGTLRP